MAIIGVLHIASAINSPAAAQTPASIILSHIADQYPEQTQQPFHLDHRMFVSTSSLLPQNDNKRTFTHLFTSSHMPQKTYVGTTSTPGAGSNGVGGLSVITIPTSTSLEPFTALMNQKLQAQWAARQFLVSDNGASVNLPIADDAKWKVSVGDLRLAPGRASGSAAGQHRGVVIEIQHNSSDAIEDSQMDSEEMKKKYDGLFRNLLKVLLQNMKLDLKLNDAKIHLAASSLSDENQQQAQHQKIQNGDTSKQSHQNQRPPGHEIAELYMEVLRGSRS